MESKAGDVCVFSESKIKNGKNVTRLIDKKNLLKKNPDFCKITLFYIYLGALKALFCFLEFMSTNYCDCCKKPIPVRLKTKKKKRFSQRTIVSTVKKKI